MGMNKTCECFETGTSLNKLLAGPVSKVSLALAALNYLFKIKPIDLYDCRFLFFWHELYFLLQFHIV